jgi:hypothetical protein
MNENSRLHRHKLTEQKPQSLDQRVVQRKKCGSHQVKIADRRRLDGSS